MLPTNVKCSFFTCDDHHWIHRKKNFRVPYEQSWNFSFGKTSDQKCHNVSVFVFVYNTQQQQENKESKLKNNDLPGEFGIPHLSIKSKQVWISFFVFFLPMIILESLFYRNSVVALKIVCQSYVVIQHLMPLIHVKMWWEKIIYVLLYGWLHLLPFPVMLPSLLFLWGKFLFFVHQFC